MPRIISIEVSQSPIKRLWNLFQSFESFTKVTIVTCLLLIIVTPYIVKNSQIFNPKAQEAGSTTQEEESALIASFSATLLQLNIQHGEATATLSEETTILQQMDQVSLTRKTYMLNLIKENPKQANELALSETERLSLPNTIQDKIEKHVEIEGEIEVFHQDDFENGKSHYEYFLRTTNAKDYNLFLSGISVPLVSQAKIRVKGIELDENIAATTEEDGGLVVLSEPQIAQAPITKNIAVILVNFQDDTRQPWTVSQVNDVIFNKTAGYYNENSFGKLRITGDIYGYYTLPISKDTRDISIVRRNVISIADPDIFFPNYTTIIIADPRPLNSFASIGLNTYVTQDGPVAFGEAWVNVMNTFTVGHELGHTFYAHHANFYNCGIKTFSRTGCTSDDYDDLFDIMDRRIVHMNGYHKEKMNFFDPSNVVNVTRSGSYTISPIESVTSLPQVLKIAIDNFKFLYIEYRQPFGVDSFLPAGILDGAMIHIAPWLIYTGDTQILDMTPSSPKSHGDVTLEVGKSFTYDGVGTITTTSQTSSALTVDVSLANSPLTPTPTPTPTPIPNSVPILTILDPDISNNGIVDQADVDIISSAFLSQPGDPKYDPSYDIKPDGIINISDFGLLSANSGLTWPPSNIEEGKASLIFYLRGEDPDGDSLTYSASSLPQGATFDPSTRRFEWKPTKGQRGQYNLNFAVSDGKDTATVSLPVMVMEVPLQASGTGTLTKDVKWNYAMGYHFTPQVDGSITALGGYFNGNKTIKLFNKATGELLASTQANSTNKWAYSPITPVAVNKNTTYTIAVYLVGSGGVYYSPNPRPPFISGNIRIEGSTYASTATNPNARPTNTSTYYMHGLVDIGFVPK